ncbi:MAG: ABC transporter permease, partial [Bacillota bacterium]
MLAAISVLDWIQQNQGLGLAGAIVLVGLVGLGLRDLLRFSVVRTLAIASVNFRQAVRRRVLWITPLLMIAVIIINQFQRPLDAQDAMRQTTMICLFATGLLVTLIILMLACTSLPHEIESRVIYTVATKPATRLEMIVGKLAGFAAVSFWILFIMGLFTWGYVRACDWQMRKAITAQLANPGQITESLRPTLEYYRDHGTLHARTLGLPESLNIYAHEPQAPADQWAPAGDEGEIVVRFLFDRSIIPAGVPEADQAASASTMGP